MTKHRKRIRKLKEAGDIYIYIYIYIHIYSKNSKESKEVPFVVTYHPSLNCLSCIVNDNLYMSREAKAVFSPGQWFHLEVHLELVAT